MKLLPTPTFDDLNPKQINNTILLGLLVVLMTSLFSVGYHHFDEHFAINEYAGYKFGINNSNELPWEFDYQVRAAFQPAIVCGTKKIFDLFGIDNPFFLATFLRIVSAFLSFFSTLLIINVVSKTIKNSSIKLWFFYLSLFLWFSVYNNVRFSSENWSSSIFALSFSLLFFNTRDKSKLFFLLNGVILGLAFLCRFQIGIMIFGLLAWKKIIDREKIGNMTILLLGILTIIGLGSIIDNWFYGEWTYTAWNYFKVNLIDDQVSRFGVTPWWFYFQKVFNDAIPPFSLIYIISIITVFIFRPRDIVSWIFFPFLLIHCMIGHKEIRFLFPLVSFLPLFIARFLEIVDTKYDLQSVVNKPMGRFFLKGFWYTNLLVLLVVCFRPADIQIAIYQKIYNNYEGPTILYFIDDNPYHRILDIHFYKRKNLTFKKIDTLEEVKSDPKYENHLFVTSSINTEMKFRSRFTSKKIYASFPEWVKNFNINNWIERTNFWYVYEVEGKITHSIPRKSKKIAGLSSQEE